MEIVKGSSEPLTIRQIMYLAVAAGKIPKSKNIYATVDNDLIELRYAGTIGYDEIEDRTREVKWINGAYPPDRPEDHDLEMAFSNQRPSRQDDEAEADALLWALQDTYAARDSLTALWEGTKRPIVLCEKDAMMSKTEAAADGYYVPVVSTRGASSHSQLWLLAGHIRREAQMLGNEHVLLWVHDSDQGGRNIGQSSIRFLERQLGEHMPTWEQVCLTEQQARDRGLLSRPDNQGDGEAWDLEALPPDEFTKLVKAAIEKYMPDGIRERLAKDYRDVRKHVEEWLYVRIRDDDELIDPDELYAD